MIPTTNAFVEKKYTEALLVSTHNIFVEKYEKWAASSEKSAFKHKLYVQIRIILRVRSIIRAVALNSYIL